LNVALYIAKRYLFSTKSKNAVNIITAISVLGVAVGTMALIVVLSVFNGFESLVKSMYNEIDPELQITAKKSKSFEFDDSRLAEIKALTNWTSLVKVYEEKVLIKTKESEQIARMKGVEVWPDTAVLQIETHLIAGNSFRDYDDENWVLMGHGLAYTLAVTAQDLLNPIVLNVPNASSKATVFSDKLFLKTTMNVSGIFAVQADYDASYIIMDLGKVQDFLDRRGAITSLDLYLEDDEEMEHVQEQLVLLFGDSFEVKNQFQQQEFLYKVLRTEKKAIFLILSFILLIAAFNIVASVIMIVLEKRKDIGTLWAMGAPERMIQKVFFYEGLLISSLGGILGLVLGISLCYAQQKFGLLSLGNQGSFIVNAYPVELQMLDVLLVLTTVLSIGIFITYIPVRLLQRKFIQKS
jgi:lipoprotein-releasing system permease protein